MKKSTTYEGLKIIKGAIARRGSFAVIVIDDNQAHVSGHCEKDWLCKQLAALLEDAAGSLTAEERERLAEIFSRPEPSLQ